MKNWLSMKMLLWNLRTEARVLLWAKSWWLEIAAPLPQFGLSERAGAWILCCGWLYVGWLKPRRQWTPIMREAHPIVKTKVVVG